MMVVVIALEDCLNNIPLSIKEKTRRQEEDEDHCAISDLPTKGRLLKLKPGEELT